MCNCCHRHDCCQMPEPRCGCERQNQGCGCGCERQNQGCGCEQNDDDRCCCCCRVQRCCRRCCCGLFGLLR
ncbi:MAG: hypothetical protein HFK10_00990 [Clostridia bacterium]|nr:hypothetical protein [Clostridia bacterium]